MRNITVRLINAKPRSVARAERPVLRMPAASAIKTKRDPANAATGTKTTPGQNPRYHESTMPARTYVANGTSGPTNGANADTHEGRHADREENSERANEAMANDRTHRDQFAGTLSAAL